MKNVCKLLLSSLLALGLISCSSCAKKDQIVPSPAPGCTGSSCPLPPAPPSTDQVFSGKDWELTVPAGWEKKPNDDVNVKVFVANQSKMNLVIFIEEAFPGTPEQYAIMALRGLRSAGARLVSAKQVEVNGEKLVLLESEKDGVRLWLWLAVKNGNGFALSCGGRSTDDWNRDICVTISNSLKLK